MIEKCINDLLHAQGKGKLVCVWLAEKKEGSSSRSNCRGDDQAFVVRTSLSPEAKTNDIYQLSPVFQLISFITVSSITLFTDGC